MLSDGILGWDVGGANIKLARLDDDGRCAVVEQAFPLWREHERLPAVLASMAAPARLGAVMAVTMTAELADCFATKRDGVAFVVGSFEAAFPVSPLWIYGVDGRFRTAVEARERPLDVAAANWMAGAALVARSHRDALFIDVGSTTADVIPIVDGRVVAEGRTDTERLRTGELVYTGCLRTPLAAVVRLAPIGREMCPVAAEHFAIAADVYLWLGDIGEDEYTCETPDGRGRSREESAARLTRIVCADREMLDDEAVTAIAKHAARAQIRQIAAGVHQVIRRLGSAAPRVAVVAGSGAFIARRAARAAGLEARDLSDDIGIGAARAAPAAAVARLLAECGSARR